MPKIAYYITAHGYGHAVRSVAVCNKIKPEIEILFRTDIPKTFFEEEMNRSFLYEKDSFDCGTAQIDTLNVDIKKTADLILEKIKTNNRKIDSEIRFLKKNSIDLVVSDIVPFAFKVAKEAGIPSVAISNFTWVDIYKPFIPKDSRFEDIVNTISSEYKNADYLLRLEPSNKMEPFTIPGSPIEPISREGINRRNKLNRMFNFSPDKKICLIYLGHYGVKDVDWKNLEKIKNWEFIGILPIQHSPQNYHIIDKSEMGYCDIIASSDAVLGKIGYGTFSEAVHNSLPLLYVPRNDFIEHEILENRLKSYKLAYPLAKTKFKKMNIEDTLTIATKSNMKFYAENGSIKSAIFIENLLS